MIKVKIVVMGSLLYDCVTYGARLPRKGETIIGKANGFYSGGKGANQAVQAARLNADVVFIGRVGDDDIGETLIRKLIEDGIDTSNVAKDKKTATGTCCIHVDDRGDNAIMIAPLANLQVCEADVDRAEKQIKECNVFLTQLETNIEATQYAIKKAHQIGVPVILNPAPATKMNLNTFKYVDFVTPNETETEYFTGILPSGDNPKSCIMAAKEFLEMGVKNVIITLGAGGAFYANKEERYLVTPYEISATDATGSGDAFNAGVAVCLAEGKSVEEAIKYANATGAVTAMRAGSQASMEKRETIETFIRNKTVKPRRIDY